MRSLGNTPYTRITTLMDRLRSECPWDREQTFETIAPYTIEESYEVADAVARKDMADLKNELGDLLFQVLFHAKMASEVDAVIRMFLRAESNLIGTPSKLKNARRLATHVHLTVSLNPCRP